jgi:uncharacterized protein YdeI (YjbR/CyaY-like superfamily)
VIERVRMSASESTLGRVPDDLPVLTFETQADFEAWMEANHATAPGVWIKVAKRASGIASVTTQEALDVALCFGWIDGVRKGLDETHFLQRYTPRRPRSKWSKVNVEKATALIERGLMREAGLREVERAKADGRWDEAYDPPSRIQVPPDLQEVLDARPELRAAFERLKSTDRYSILYRMHHAKRPETRARRIADAIARLERY